jgi:hypothetical protein
VAVGYLIVAGFCFALAPQGYPASLVLIEEAVAED